LDRFGRGPLLPQAVQLYREWPLQSADDAFWLEDRAKVEIVDSRGKTLLGEAMGQECASRPDAMGAKAIETYRRVSINVHDAFPLLTSLVEDIVDWDFPDANIARSTSIRVLPSTVPYFIIQYRDSVRSGLKFGDSFKWYDDYRNVLTRSETGIGIVRPTGPMGLIVVRVKPEAFTFLFGESLQYFSDAKIDLGEIFAPHEIEQLESMVSRAATSADRARVVAQFLSGYGCLRDPDPVMRWAAAWLRANPSLPVKHVATELGVSERQLLRKFQNAFGVGPKQFARSVRIEKVFAARRRGSNWADIAYGCGFADQAHMINDFNAVVGATPGRALSPSPRASELSRGEPIRDYIIW
jgi:AraC-like DNA-binding protein